MDISPTSKKIKEPSSYEAFVLFTTFADKHSLNRSALLPNVIRIAPNPYDLVSPYDDYNKPKKPDLP